jgi:hypothetical protein
MVCIAEWRATPGNNSFLDLFVQVSVGTLLAFTMVAISVLIVRYAPPDEMQMEGPDPGSLESLASQAGQSERDEDILGDPFGNGKENEYPF